jgi:hypothetical protein
MFIRKPAIYLSLSGLLVLASACHGSRKPRLDASVGPVAGDSKAGDAGACQLGVSDAGMCQGATMLDVDFCHRAWVEVTPEPAVFGQDVSVRARADDSDRNALEVEWTSEPDGRFADYGAASTTFHCESLGRKTLHMAAVDVRGCVSEVTVEINCVPAPSK